jgi:O-antigen ligase
MSVAAPGISSPPTEFRTTQPAASLPAGTFAERQHCTPVAPNALVRWVFYLWLFCIPFAYVSFPGTGGRVTVIRLLQILLAGAVFSQPRVCIRFVPTAIFWFLGYCAVRIFAGLWLAPELRVQWLPSTLNWLQVALPWFWVMFNVLQFPWLGQRGLWALIWGCGFCALLHIAGIGVVVLEGGEGRSSVFGENANAAGATYAIALIVLVGLGLLRNVRLSRRLLVFPLIAIMAAGVAKTGSRSAVLILALGIAILLVYGQAFGSKTKRFTLVAAIAIILAGIAWQLPTVAERFHQLSSPAELQRREGRVRMAPVLWEMFLRSPAYGSGPDHYQFELTRRAMPYRLQDQILVSSHNLALTLLVETGLIGFLLFSCGVKPSIGAAWRERFKPYGSLPLALVIPLVIAGATVSDPSHYLVFWFAMAYALAGVS